MVKTYIVEKILSDNEIADNEGRYFTTDDIRILIDGDADVYTSDGKLLLKLRKQLIPHNICIDAVDAFRSFSKKRHANRGAAAGLLNRDKIPTYVGEYIKSGKFRTKFISNTSGIQSKQDISNMSPSNIVGFYDRPNRNIKGMKSQCRLTAFNRDFPGLWEKALPFIYKCDQIFKTLVPFKYEKQKLRAEQTKEFIIRGTSFSTVTLNYSWQTALHRDSGDYLDGFGNVVVLEDHDNVNTYTGGYTCFPQYGIGVNVRQGDFLAMDVHEWHCNTNLIADHDNVYGKWNKTQIKNLWYLNRLSVVLYLRHNMLRCKK